MLAFTVLFNTVCLVSFYARMSYRKQKMPLDAVGPKVQECPPEEESGGVYGSNKCSTLTQETPEFMFYVKLKVNVDLF